MSTWRAVGQYWYVFALLLVTSLLGATLFVISQPQQYTGVSTLAITYQSDALVDADLLHAMEKDVAQRIVSFSQSDAFWEFIEKQGIHERSFVRMDARTEGAVVVLEITVKDTDRERARAVLHAAHRALLQSHTSFHGLGESVRVDSFMEPAVSFAPNDPSLVRAAIWSLLVWVVSSGVTVMILFAVVPVSGEVRTFSRAPADRNGLSRGSAFQPSLSVASPVHSSVSSASLSARRYVIDHDVDHNGVSTMQEALEEAQMARGPRLGVDHSFVHAGDASSVDGGEIVANSSGVAVHGPDEVGKVDEMSEVDAVGEVDEVEADGALDGAESGSIDSDNVDVVGQPDPHVARAFVTRWQQQLRRRKRDS